MTADAAMVELLVRLERASYDNATAFVVVAIDGEGNIVNATGPFTEPEAALVQAGIDDVNWKRHAEPGEGDFKSVVVPMWEPTP